MTAPPPPTVETLAVELSNLRRLLDERFATQRREQETADRVLSAWKDTSNEMRAMLADTLTTRISKDDYDARHRLLEQQLNSETENLKRLIDECTRRVASIEGERSGRAASFAQIGFIITAGVALVGLIIHVFLGKITP